MRRFPSTSSPSRSAEYFADRSLTADNTPVDANAGVAGVLLYALAN